MKLMANAAKGLMLAAFMAVGTTTVNAQENSEETTYKPVTVGNWVKGEEVTGNGQEVYIYNVGSGTFISGTSATVKDIKEAIHGLSVMVQMEHIHLLATTQQQTVFT